MLDVSPLESWDVGALFYSEGWWHVNRFFLAKQICHGAYVQAFPDDRNIQKKPFQNCLFFLRTGLYSEETKHFRNVGYLKLETDLPYGFQICF